LAPKSFVIPSAARDLQFSVDRHKALAFPSFMLFLRQISNLFLTVLLQSVIPDIPSHPRGVNGPIGLPQPSAKSCHAGFIDLISASFFALDHPLISFSLAIAFPMYLNVS
jgi:hypothetical protein